MAQVQTQSRKIAQSFGSRAAAQFHRSAHARQVDGRKGFLSRERVGKCLIRLLKQVPAGVVQR